MSKDSAKKVSRKFNEKVTFSTKDMELGARALCNKMARYDGVSVGGLVTRAVWKLAQEELHPDHIAQLLELANIEKPSDFNPNYKFKLDFKI